MRRITTSNKIKQSQDESKRIKQFDARRTCLTDFKVRSKDHKMQCQVFHSPNRQPKEMSNDFKQIKQEIDSIKGEINQYFGEKMTSSCRQFSMIHSPSSPLSLAHHSSPHFQLSLISDRISSSSSSSEDKFYQIKFKLLSEEFESLKRKYHLRKIEHKQLINKLCKKINSMQEIIRNKQGDIQQYKKLLGKQVSSIREQINNCIQNQMTSTIIQNSREEYITEYDFKKERMEFSSVLNPEYETNQVITRVDQKEAMLLEVQERLERLKFQNLELENLLQAKEKSEAALRVEVEQQGLAVSSLKQEVENQKQVSGHYQEQLEELMIIRRVEYEQWRDQENYLRMELESCLRRESDFEEQFRSLDQERRELSQKEMHNIRDQLAQKNVQIIQMQSRLKVKLLKIVSLTQKLNGLSNGESKQQSKQSNEDTQVLPCNPPSSVAQLQLQKLKEQNSHLHQSLLQTSTLIEQLKSTFEHQLYTLEIQYRRRGMQYQDKLKQFMKMIDAGVSDIILKEQDFQLIQKEQQLVKVNSSLMESNVRVCLIEGEIIMFKHQNLVKRIEPHEKCIHSMAVLQFQNKHLINLLLQLNLKMDTIRGEEGKYKGKEKEEWEQKEQKQEEDQEEYVAQLQQIKDSMKMQVQISQGQ